MDSDQEEFFKWKGKLEQECRNGMKNQSALELARSLGLNKDVAKFKVPKDAEEKPKPPSNQRVKEINKQKELDEAQKKLEETKTKVEEKLGLLAERWKKVETGQVVLKQNLVKYNNFVKEKRGKTADGISRRMTEKQRQQEKKKTFRRMENQLDQLKEARAALEKGVEAKSFYSEFMETALSRGTLGGKRFESMQALVDRCLALHDNRNNLLRQLETVNEKIQREDNDLQTLEESMMTTLLDHNLSVNLLQRRLDDAAATKLQKMRNLQNITEADCEKRLEITTIQQAIKNMHNMVMNHRGKTRSKGMGIETQLKQIMEHFGDLKALSAEMASLKPEDYNVPLHTAATFHKLS